MREREKRVETYSPTNIIIYLAFANGDMSLGERKGEDKDYIG